jgi:hypothetical protein
MIAGGFALCRADYDPDGTITIAWGIKQVNCSHCLALLGVRRDEVEPEKEED